MWQLIKSKSNSKKMLNINGKPIMRSSNSVESSLRQKFTGEIVILCKDVCIDGEEMKFYIKVLS